MILAHGPASKCVAAQLILVPQNVSEMQWGYLNLHRRCYLQCPS
jgi:hypothetical protein